MKTFDCNYIATNISNLAGIPTRIYQKGVKAFYSSVVFLPKDPISPYLESILGIDDHVGYFITPTFDYYGIVSCGETKLIVGPSRQSRPSDQALREIAFQCDVPPEEREEFFSGMKQIVAMPLSSLIQILCAVNYAMNGEKLSLEDVEIHEDAQKAFIEDFERRKAEETEGFTQEIPHNTLALERTLNSIVRRGDTAALKEWISKAPAVRGGTLATNQLRQLKNTFVVTATLISRAAISGGMDEEEALSLSDAFIQKCELLFDAEKIANLQYRMVLTYTEKVEQLRFGKEPSKFLSSVVNYTHKHLNEPVDIEGMSKALFMSRTHMAAKFKKETGMTLSEYVINEKVSEAKRLLIYTNKPVSLIASFLGFSSQGHFANVFRQKVGKTPNEYRKSAK